MTGQDLTRDAERIVLGAMMLNPAVTSQITKRLRRTDFADLRHSSIFDAITTKRSYAEALSVEEALSLMKRSRGKKLDPAIFDRFMVHMTEKYKERETEVKIADDFDPCQPHVKLKRG